MKILLFALLSLAVMPSFIACDDEDEVYLGKQIDEASVTYTVPLYRPTLEWLDYIVSYTDQNGKIVNDTISHDNVISGKVSLVTLAEKEPIDKEDGRASWVKNENFTTIPDSCCVKVRMRYKSNVDMPDRIDLIVPQPDMTAVVRFTDGTQRSIIGKGQNSIVTPVMTQTELFKSIFEKDYNSNCTFYPYVQIN